MCTLVLWLGQIWHFLPVCHILSAVWRSGVLQHSAHSGRQIHSTKSWTHTIQTAAHYWFCVFVSEWVYVCVPVHHKSSAWPDTVVCSSWRWLQCPPQKLPAETVSANKNHQKQTNKHHAADLTTWSVCETILSLLAPRKFPMRVPKTSPAYISTFLQIKHLLLLSRCVLTSCWSLSFSRHYSLWEINHTLRLFSWKLNGCNLLCDYPECISPCCKSDFTAAVTWFLSSSHC